jgi:acetylglutamate kinase
MSTHADLQSLRVAIPYIRRFKGQTFVIKLSGSLCRPGRVVAEIVEQASLLHQLGIQLVFVHGGGDQADELAARLNTPVKRVAGRRVTDEPTLEIAKMAFAGTVNTDLVAACAKSGVPAVGLTGVDANLISAGRRPPVDVHDRESGKTLAVDYGLVGDIHSASTRVVETLLADGFVPVIASLAADSQGQVLNVNADTVAARLAGALGAAKLFLLTNVDGIFRDLSDSTTLCSLLDLSDLAELEASGQIRAGMLPKLAACRLALDAGVSRVHVINGSEPDTLLAEVFTNEGCGTLVVTRHGAPSQPTEPQPA